MTERYDDDSDEGFPLKEDDTRVATWMLAFVGTFTVAWGGVCIWMAR